MEGGRLVEVGLYLDFTLLKLNYFRYSSYLFPKVFSCQISCDSNQWFSRNTVLCKSNANEIRRNSSFVLATFLRKVIEFSKDVSKGSKRKNHDLPRKFERAKFEVATFQGNQTKKHDTKFEAANCYVTQTAANDIADQALVNKLNSYR